MESSRIKSIFAGDLYISGRKNVLFAPAEQLLGSFLEDLPSLTLRISIF
jgi:hypothetical protein